MDTATDKPVDLAHVARRVVETISARARKQCADAMLNLLAADGTEDGQAALRAAHAAILELGQQTIPGC